MLHVLYVVFCQCGVVFFVVFVILWGQKSNSFKILCCYVVLSLWCYVPILFCIMNLFVGMLLCLRLSCSFVVLSSYIVLSEVVSSDIMT